MKEKLVDICTPKQWKTLVTSELKDEGYPVYGANGVIGYYDEYNHEVETVMVTCRGATCGTVNISKPFSYINGNAMCMDNLREDINVKYLYYALKHYDFSEVISGSAQPQITRQGFNNVIIKIVEKSKQMEIVKVLSKFEEIILKKKNQILEYDQLIKSRFVEMFSSFKETRKIGEIASICRGSSPRPISKFITKGDGVNWIKIGDTDKNSIYVTQTAEKVTKEGADKSRRVRPGDFILSNSMSFGRPYILGIHGCVHDGWLIISDYQKTYEPIFFYYLLRSSEVQAQFDGSANGATVRNLNSDLVREVRVITPSLDLQNEFVVFAKQIDKLKFAVQKSLDETQTLFDSLMQKYFG